MKHTPLKFMGILLAVIIIAAIAFGWLVLSRGFSARLEPSAAETYVARHVRLLAIPRGAREVKNPVAASPEVLSAAMEHFADHCSSCHGNDGQGRTLIGRGLYPKPPDMTLPATQELSDGELYYIIENGVRFTGMPAFGEEIGNEKDEESWALVRFIRHLPKITDDELAEMKNMNPKSPRELKQEETIRKFLEGDDTAVPAEGHQHQH